MFHLYYKVYNDVSHKFQLAYPDENKTIYSDVRHVKF